MRRRRQLLSAVSTDLAVPNASSITVTSQDSACKIGSTLIACSKVIWQIDFLKRY
jgi:hypothetical protein